MGTVAVFVSNNQAGTVALMLAGTIFLLMGINGSPLIRARYQDYELLMARRRQEIVDRIEDENPEDAQQVLNVLRTVDPQSSRDPVVAQASAHLYERQVINRLHELGFDAEHTGGPGDMGRDAVLHSPRGKIAVQVKAGSTPLSKRAIFATSQIPKELADGILLIASNPLPTELPRRLREFKQHDQRPLEVIRWVDSQDDIALKEAIRRLKSKISHG
jgi:hypothetical protein